MRLQQQPVVDVVVGEDEMVRQIWLKFIKRQMKTDLI